jgi:hypothetical protein
MDMTRLILVAACLTAVFGDANAPCNAAAYTAALNGVDASNLKLSDRISKARDGCKVRCAAIPRPPSSLPLTVWPGPPS